MRASINSGQDRWAMEQDTKERRLPAKPFKLAKKPRFVSSEELLSGNALRG